MLSTAKNIKPVAFYEKLIRQGVREKDAQFIACVQFGLMPEELVKLQQNEKQQGGVVNDR